MMVRCFVWMLMMAWGAVGMLSAFNRTATKSHWRIAVQSRYPFNMTKTFTTYLQQTVSPEFDIPLTFETVPMEDRAMYQAVKDRTVDFGFANSMVFGCIQKEFRPRLLLTMRTTAGSEFAVVTIVRKNSTVNSIHDLGGKILSATSFLMFAPQWYQSYLTGLDLRNELGQVRLSGSSQTVVNDVRSGSADVGFVKSGYLESMNLTHEFKIINELNHTGLDGEKFPYRHSTFLFPERAFYSVHEETKDTRLEAMMIYHLLNMTSSHPAAVSGDYTGWTTPVSYYPTHLMQDTLGYSFQDGPNRRCYAASGNPDPYASLTCPEGSFRLSSAEIATACSKKGISCPPGYFCVCSPCRPADNVEIFSSTGTLCKKTKICESIEQQQESHFIIRDNLERGLDLSYVLHVPASDSLLNGNGVIKPFANFTYKVPYSLFYRGDTAVEFAINGTQINQSPTLIRVLERQCNTDEKANTEGECKRTRVNNFLPQWLRHMGIALFLINSLTTAVLFVWTFLNWNSRIIRAAQPMFLILVLLGCLVSSATLITLSMDDKEYSTDTLDSVCQGQVWLYGFGFALSYSALFAKMFRVKSVTINVIARKKMAPVRAGDNSIWWYLTSIAGMMLFEVFLIGTWMGVSPMQWKRNCTDSSQSDFCESVGHCSSEHGLAFGAFLLCMHLALLVLVLVICYQVRSVPAEFAEHKWITAATVSSIEILILTPPFVALTWNSQTASALITMFAIFFNDLGVLVMVFVPKIFMAYSVHTKEQEHQEDMLHKLRVDARKTSGKKSGKESNKKYDKKDNQSKGLVRNSSKNRSNHAGSDTSPFNSLRNADKKNQSSFTLPTDFSIGSPRGPPPTRASQVSS
ncbi:hypothetical protein AAMO2058_001417600 [Amorphochlora amoebiformis]